MPTLLLSLSLSNVRMIAAWQTAARDSDGLLERDKTHTDLNHSGL